MNSSRNNYTAKSKCGQYEIMNRKTKKCKPCLKGEIVRKSYYRTGKKSKKTTYVHESCIKSRGLPGKTSLKYMRNNGSINGIGPLKKGELGKYGYHNITRLTKKDRHLMLSEAVKEYGAPKLVRKLGALRTYLKNTTPRASKIFYEDQRWIRVQYSREFKGDLKKSKLYKK
tara:strand:- start:285 stop:797 length:513 start_codon:yes stop_codon:yes gene_type:complete